MLGIIGGTGLYQLQGLVEIQSREVEAPSRRPSAPLSIGALSIGLLGDRPVAYPPGRSRP
jgi:purine nucleoside phosphorylase